MTDPQNSKPKTEGEDITGIFDHYRISARGIWNTAFWPDADFQNWDSIDRFDEIQKLLFAELVLGKLGMEWPLEKLFGNPIPFFQICPSSAEVPILIQNPRPEASHGYWDHPVNSIKPGQAELHFTSYFDWNRMDYADLRYYRAFIARFDAWPELVGREALIDCQNAKVYLKEQ